MQKKPTLFLLAAIASPFCITWAATVFHVDVGVVVVSFTVKDNHGRYVTGLQPQEIAVREDGIQQKITSFTESSDPAGPPASGGSLDQPWMANSVYVLFDTSNSMYEGFARAEDSIEAFIRDLDKRQAVAVYSFSKTMTRLAPLTHDHGRAIRGLRDAVAGDSTAVLNAILLTLRDAARVPGRKVIVVFSNGPDDSSVVTPNDVGRVAEEEGIPVYIIATKAHDETCQRAFNLLSTSSGGKLFLADQRPQQLQAFQTVDEDLKHTYTITYYPRPNENNGWRKLEVQVLGSSTSQYQVTARSGYWSSRHATD